MPADVQNARMNLINGTRKFKSVVRYECIKGFIMVGRAELMCDVDEKWNGPPPRCEPVYCEEPPQIRHGGFRLSTNSTRFGTIAAYYCSSNRHRIVGNPKLRCLPDGSWDANPPVCRLVDSKDKNFTPTVLPTRSKDGPSVPPRRLRPYQGIPRNRGAGGGGG